MTSTFTGPNLEILHFPVNYVTYYCVVDNTNPVVEWLDVCEWLRPTSEIVEVR